MQWCDYQRIRVDWFKLNYVMPTWTILVNIDQWISINDPWKFYSACAFMSMSHITWSKHVLLTCCKNWTKHQIGIFTECQPSEFMGKNAWHLLWNLISTTHLVKKRLKTMSNKYSNFCVKFFLQSPYCWRPFLQSFWCWVINPFEWFVCIFSTTFIVNILICWRWK